MEAGMFCLRLTAFCLCCWKSQRLHTLVFIGIKERTTGRICLTSDAPENSWSTNKGKQRLRWPHGKPPGKVQNFSCHVIRWIISVRILIPLDLSFKGLTVRHYCSTGVTVWALMKFRLMSLGDGNRACCGAVKSKRSCTGLCLKLRSFIPKAVI